MHLRPRTSSRLISSLVVSLSGLWPSLSRGRRRRLSLEGRKRNANYTDVEQRGRTRVYCFARDECARAYVWTGGTYTRKNICCLLSGECYLLRVFPKLIYLRIYPHALRYPCPGVDDWWICGEGQNIR